MSRNPATAAPKWDSQGTGSGSSRAATGKSSRIAAFSQFGMMNFRMSQIAAASIRPAKTAKTP